MNTFICYACRETKPSALCDKHHAIPKTAGGTDADLVNLCKNCHQNLHALEYAILNPKRRGEVHQILGVFKDEDTKARIADLAYKIVKARAAKADGKEIENEEKTITFVLDKQSYTKLLFAARDHRMSITNFVKGIILKHMENL